MTSTSELGLPLLQPAQAQKHVTVNEALLRIDGLAQLVLQSVSTAVPPAMATEGQAFGIPSGALGAWSGSDGSIGIARSGGWDFVQPRTGWRAFVVDEGAEAIHDGTGWQMGRVTVSPNGSGLGFSVVEFDHTVVAGATDLTAIVIPANSLVFGVTGRVLTPIIGTLSSWRLGNPGAAGRYGSGIGLGAGSFVTGLLGQPTAFYADERLQLDATGGSFAGGSVRLAVHLLALSLPRP